MNCISWPDFRLGETMILLYKPWSYSLSRDVVFLFLHLQKHSQLQHILLYIHTPLQVQGTFLRWHLQRENLSDILQHHQMPLKTCLLLPVLYWHWMARQRLCLNRCCFFSPAQMLNWNGNVCRIKTKVCDQIKLIEVLQSQKGRRRIFYFSVITPCVSQKSSVSVIYSNKLGFPVPL